MNNLGGTYDTIDIEYVLAGCKSDLNLRDSTIEDLYLKDTINLGIKELRNMGTQIPAQGQLPIDQLNFNTKLPSGFIQLLYGYPIVYTDASGFAVNGLNNQTITQMIVDADGDLIGTNTIPFMSGSPFCYGPAYESNTFYKNSPYGTNFTLAGTMRIENGYMWFSTNINAAYVKFMYLSTNIDSNNDLVIPAYCEKGLRAFGNHRYLRRPDNVQKYGNLWQAYYNEWVDEKQGCKAISNRTDGLQMGFINYMWKSLI